MNSGHQFEPSGRVWWGAMASLNPFEFRASVRTEARERIASELEGLNPFEFRASVRTPRSARTAPLGPSLNPFEFRASVRTAPIVSPSTHSWSLNPFEFRASVRTVMRGSAAIRPTVSIPLNSGHQFEQAAGSNSGWLSKGLNPFEFRASVRTRSAAPRSSLA